jgi:hypothetical protein
MNLINGKVALDRIQQFMQVRGRGAAQRTRTTCGGSGVTQFG